MKLVILDCDGTLVDSQNGICEAMVHAFTGLNLEAPSRAATLSVVGLSLPEAFAVLAAEHGEDVRAALAHRYRTAFVDLKRDPAHHEPLFPDIARIVADLGARDDIALAIATGKSRRGVDRLFEREDWARHFDSVQTADEHPSKPHPAMIHAAMADTGIGPERTVMVGDTTYDVEMAIAADVGALGVTWGYHSVDELTGAGAHMVIESVAQLPAGIDAFFSGREKAA